MRKYTTLEESRNLYYKGLDANTASLRYVSNDGKVFELCDKEHYCNYYKHVSPSMEIVSMFPCWTVGDLLEIISHARYQDSECDKIVIEPKITKCEYGIYINTNNGSRSSCKFVDVEMIRCMLVLIENLINANMIDDCIVESMRKCNNMKNENQEGK